MEISGSFGESDADDSAPASGMIGFYLGDTSAESDWEGEWARDELDGYFSGTIEDGGYWGSDADYEGSFDVYRVD